MPAELPPRCCGNCKHAVPTSRSDARIRCDAPLPIWLRSLLIENGRTVGFLRDGDGEDCPAFQAKEPADGPN